MHVCTCIDISLGMLLISSPWKYNACFSLPPFSPPPAALFSSHPSDKRDYTAEKSVPGLKERSQAYKTFCIIWMGFRCLRAKNQLHLWWCK